MVAFILSIGLLIGLMFKRKEHPTNMYLLLAFVSCVFDHHTYLRADFIKDWVMGKFTGCEQNFAWLLHQYFTDM